MRWLACRSQLSRKLLVHSMLPLPALILLVQLLDSMPADQAAAVEKLNGNNSILLEVTVMLAEVSAFCSSSLVLVVHCSFASPEPTRCPALLCPALPCLYWPCFALPLPLPLPLAMPCFAPHDPPCLLHVSLPCPALSRPVLP